MRLSELTQPPTPLSAIPTYINERLNPPPLNPSEKPKALTKDQQEGLKTVKVIGGIFRLIGLVLTLLVLSMFGYNLGGFIIAAVWLAVVILPKQTLTILTGLNVWLITHLGGIGVYATLSIGFLFLWFLDPKTYSLLFLMIWFVAHFALAIVGTGISYLNYFVLHKAPAADGAQAEVDPLDELAGSVTTALLDYYAPPADFRPRITPLRSQYLSDEEWIEAVDQLDADVLAKRSAATAEHIKSITYEDERQEVAVVTVYVKQRSTKSELAKKVELLTDNLPGTYGVNVVLFSAKEDPDPRATVTFRVNLVPLPTPMEQLSELKLADNFFADNPSGKLLSWTAGVEANGSLVTLPVHHTLVYGTTGAGKGSAFRGVLVHLMPYVSQGLAQIYYLDPKKGETKSFRKVKQFFRRLEGDSHAMADIVDEVFDLMRRRQDIEDEWEVSTDNPAIVLMIDEIPSLTVDPVFLKRRDPNLNNMTTAEKLFTILAQGRSDRIYVMGATQYGTKAVLGNLRDNFVVRIMLRPESDSVASYYLNVDGSLLETIPVATEDNGWKSAGIGYIIKEGAEAPVLMRFGYADTNTLIRVAETLSPPPPSPEERDDEPTADDILAKF